MDINRDNYYLSNKELKNNYKVLKLILVSIVYAVASAGVMPRIRIYSVDNDLTYKITAFGIGLVLFLLAYSRAIEAKFLNLETTLLNKRREFYKNDFVFIKKNMERVPEKHRAFVSRQLIEHLSKGEYSMYLETEIETETI